MKRTPVEVKGLRKAPAIVVNRGDWVRIGGDWYEVVRYAGEHAVLVDGRVIAVFQTDEIVEWRKG